MSKQNPENHTQNNPTEQIELKRKVLGIILDLATNKALPAAAILTVLLSALGMPELVQAMPELVTLQPLIELAVDLGVTAYVIVSAISYTIIILLDEDSRRDVQDKNSRTNIISTQGFIVQFANLFTLGTKIALDNM